MTREEEAKLLQEMKSGSMNAFERFVRAHEKTVYHLALRTLGNAQDAEDAAQEVFLKAYTAISSFRGESSLSVWLYRITSNVCIDALRRRRESVSLSCADESGEETEIEIADERFDPAALYERRELRETLQAALQRLPEDAREILLLREVGGRSYEEISELLELDLGTVKSRIFRARKKLCAYLTEKGNFFVPPSSKGKEGGVRA